MPNKLDLILEEVSEVLEIPKGILSNDEFTNKVLSHLFSLDDQESDVIWDRLSFGAKMWVNGSIDNLAKKVAKEEIEKEISIPTENQKLLLIETSIPEEETKEILTENQSSFAKKKRGRPTKIDSR